MHIYNLKLTLAKMDDRKLTEEEKIIIDMKNNAEGWIHRCVEEFNVKCQNSKVNRKHVEVEDVNAKILYLRLESELPIEFPGRALKELSKMLISSEPGQDENYQKGKNFFNENISYGKVFRTEVLAQVDCEDEEGILNVKKVDVSDLSDIDFYKLLLDYIVKAKHPYTAELNIQAKAMTKIKLLAVESGIIEWDNK